jgi:hypothetical protein
VAQAGRRKEATQMNKVIIALFAILLFACDNNEVSQQQPHHKRRAFILDCSDPDSCLYAAGQKCDGDYDVKWNIGSGNAYAISFECK